MPKSDRDYKTSCRDDTRPFPLRERYMGKECGYARLVQDSATRNRYSSLTRPLFLHSAYLITPNRKLKK